MVATALSYDHHQRRGGKQYYDKDGRKETKIEKQLPKIGEKMGVEVEVEAEEVEVGKVAAFE